MQKLMPKRLTSIALFLLINGFLVSCTKTLEKGNPHNTLTSTTTTTTSGTTTTTSGTTTTGGSTTTSGTTTTSGSTTTTSGTTTTSLYSLLNSFTRVDGTYTMTQAATDYKSSVNGWSDARMNISGGKLRTTLTKNVVGPDGGLVSWIDVPDASQYQLQFDMMFDSQFDFSAGGKIGYGFLIGEGNTGGDPGWDGNGGSARIMWYKGWDGRVYLQPYVYYKDQPGQYGNDFGKSYPATGSLQKGTWYTVKMLFNANTGSNTDGRIQMVVNGTTLLDQPIRWTTNDLQRLVNRVTFETFRGGADASWTSTTDGNIYFDNVSWNVLAY
jgi:hypothetical protein